MAAPISTRRLLLVAVALLVLLTKESLQQEEEDDYIFLREPPKTLYFNPGDVALIYCNAARVDSDGNEIPVHVTLYRNAEALHLFDLPLRHQAINVGGKIAGFVIDPVTQEDSSTKYHCAVVRNGETVIATSPVRLLVGDGTPFAVTVVLIDQQLYSLTLAWDPAPTPPEAPIDNYTILVFQEASQETFDVIVQGNDTEAELVELQPDTVYQVVVFGANRNGEGQRSEEFLAYTLVPEVPDPPRQVDVSVEVGNHSSTITVTWTLSEIDPVSMTPIEHYIAFYGMSESSLQEITTEDNRTTTITTPDITTGGEYTIGVAAVNSAGRSPITYSSEGVAFLGCRSLIVPDFGQVGLSAGLSVGSTATYSCSEGYEVNGTGIRECKENGQWSGSEPFCQLLPDFTEPSVSGALLETTETIAVGVAAGIFLFLIVIVIIAILVLRYRSKKFATFTLEQGSPGSVKKFPANNHYIDPGNNLADNSVTATELHVYLSEPRAAGSPPPSDYTTTVVPDSVSSSTFGK